MQNVKSEYKTSALIVNWATEDQDQDVHDALRKNKNFRITKKNETNNEDICRVAKADNIMINKYEI